LLANTVRPGGGCLEGHSKASKRKRHGEVGNLHVVDKVKIILTPFIGLLLVFEGNL